MNKAKIAKYTIGEILKERLAQCETCGRKEMLTLDHIVPVQILMIINI